MIDEQGAAIVCVELVLCLEVIPWGDAPDQLVHNLHRNRMRRPRQAWTPAPRTVAGEIRPRTTSALQPIAEARPTGYRQVVDRMKA